jgi:low affinity Fe/Cu permease
MEEKKDIGQFFKDKLKDGEKSPSTDLWDRINTSLDKEDRLRKNSFPYWIMGLGITLLFILGFIFYTSNFIESDSDSLKKENTIKAQAPVLATPSESNEDRININYSLDEVSENKNLSEIESKIDDSIKNSVARPKKNMVVSMEKESLPKIAETIDSYRVSKKYHYYNSEDGEEWSTSDKNLIDSLLYKNDVKLDSVEPKKNNM